MSKRILRKIRVLFPIVATTITLIVLPVSLVGAIVTLFMGLYEDMGNFVGIFIMFSGFAYIISLLGDE